MKDINTQYTPQLLSAVLELLTGTDDLNVAINNVVVAYHATRGLNYCIDDKINRLLRLSKSLTYKEYQEFSSKDYLPQVPAIPPVCANCNDTRQVYVGEFGSVQMCTRCPLPCSKCASGPYCRHTPCTCDCHVTGVRK